MKIKHGLAAALAFLFITGVQTFAASPGQVSYQGTLRKNGVLFSGTAAMEFRITNADGSVVYWTSGSTDVAVSTGLFRYGLGSPNETDFGNIVWKEITPYVQMNLDGGWLPREPLYTSVYSLHSRTAESSTGTFTINGGDLRLTAASGSKGIYFQDGTAQYSAPGWAVTGSYTSFAGGAGVGTLTPATRLDVQAAGGDTYVQFWRNSTGVIKATMTAAGLLYADGSQLSNLPAGADNMGNHTATTALLMANFPINNSGAITANGQITTYSSATVAASLGLGVPRVRLAGGVELSSYSAGGLFISSNVTLAAGGRYFGNGSMLSGVNDSLGTHIATQTLNMAGYDILSVSTMTVNRALWFDSNVEISSAAGAYSGVYISTNVNLAAGARYYGDGSGLTGIVGVDNLGDHTMTTNLVTGANWISYNGSASGLNLDASGNVGIGQAAGSARLDVRGSGGFVQIWRTGLPVVASMTATGLLYADGSQLRNLPAGGTATQALNMASFDIANVSTVTLSSVTSSGIGVVFSTNVLLMNGRLGINTSLPQESLDVNGSFKSSSLSGAGNQCVYADNNGRLLLSGGGLCGSASGLDNLGNHTMLSNLITGSNWISFDGSNGGLSVNVSSNVGIGVLSAATRLDVQARAGDTYAQIWRNSSGVIQASMTAAGIIYADASGMVNLPSGGDSFGNHTATQAVNMGGNQLLNVSSITVAGASGLGAARLDLSSNVELSSETSSSLGAGLRVSTNVYVVGFSSAAKYYGDGSALTGVLASPDNLGNHTATLTLDLAGNDLISVSTLTLSSVTSSGLGVVFSTNLLLMNGNLGVNTAFPQASLDVNGNIMSSSLSGAGNNCVYADPTGQLQLAAGPCGSAAGLDNLGNHRLLQNLETGGNLIAYGPGAAGGGLTINISSNVGIGVLSAATRLDVQPDGGDAYSQIWRDSAGVEQASMTAGGLLYADASKMRNLPSGADNLGNHTASQNLDMASKEILSVSTITVGYLSSSGAGVVFTTNALVMNGGRLGINTSLPQASLDVNGSMISSSLAGSGARCVHVNNSGQLQLAGSDCGTIAGNDNLGDHTMTSNLVTANHWINGDFDNEGIWVDSAGNVSIGTNTAYGRLDVKGSVGNYIQVWRNFSDVIQASMSVTGVLYADGSKLRNLPDGLGTHIATQTLSMAGYQILSVSSVTVTGATGIGAARLRFGSNVEISSETSVSLGAGVRVSSNVYIVGFSSAARYYGDGSGLTGVSGSDDLGDHLATQDLDLNTFNLVNVASLTARGAVTSYSSFTIAGELGLGAALRFDGNVNISSATGLYGGIFISTNVNLVAGAKYYVNGVEVSGGGGNIVDTLAATLVSGNNAGGNNIVNAGNITAASLGLGVTPATDILEINDADASTLTSGLKFTNFSCSGTDKLTVGVDGKVVCQPDAVGGGTGNLVDNLFDTLGMGDDAGGRAIQNAGSITGSSMTATGALGLFSARVRFNSAVEISSDTSGTFAGVNISSNVYIVGFSSALKYYGDGSALTGIVASDDLGSHIATQDLDLAGFNLLNTSVISGAAGAGVSFSTSVLIGGNIGASGGAVFSDGPVGIGTNFPLTSLHISSAAGYAGNMVIISTGVTPVITMNGAGEIYAARFFGDGSALTGVAGGGSLPAILAASGDAGAGYIVNLSSLAIGRPAAYAPLDVQAAAADTNVQIWRSLAGTDVASMTVAGVFHAGSAFLYNAEIYSNLAVSNVQISSHLAVGNQSGISPSVVIMSSDVLEEGDIDNLNPNVGVLGALLLNPTTHRSGVEMVIGGNFRGGIVPGMGVDKNFPTLIGVRAGAWANTSGAVLSAYGLYVKSEQTAGTVTNNYGIDVKAPDFSGGSISNNYGIYVRDQSGISTTSDFNIYSAGAASKNIFEGTVQMHLPSKLKVDLQGAGAIPTAVGEMYYCSDCTVSKIVISTGTAQGAYSDAMGAAIN